MGPFDVKILSDAPKSICVQMECRVIHDASFYTPIMLAGIVCFDALGCECDESAQLSSERLRMKKPGIAQHFEQIFGPPPTVFRAPGRVNLIGEHTDYNEGFVLPAAIGFSCCVAIASRDDRKLVLHSENFDETKEASLDGLNGATRNWADYPLGVAWGLQQAGYRLRGAYLYIPSDVPLGAGLSSSAAVEVATGYALLSNSE